ncbi:MAG TPA: hypothetical protein PKI62_13405 [bacterium]|nr:hypothetical protein [bacterium]HPR89548.1 hypothetical protein [bacterium]
MRLNLRHLQLYRHGLWLRLLLFLLCTGTAGLWGQTGLERSYAELQRQLLALRQENGALMVASDSLALEIQQLKSSEPLSFFARRRLESALRRAQELASRREENLSAQLGLQGEAARLAVRLDDWYAARIDSLLEAAGRMSGSQRQETAAQVEPLRRRKAALQEALNSVAGALPPPGALNIRNTDTPGEIAAKADLLRTREGQVRAQAQLLERRAGQVRQESALRKKMADLVSDLSVFEQRDETAQRVSRSEGSGVTTSTEKSGSSFGPESGVLVERASPADQLLRLDLRTLSAEDTDLLLRELEGQRRVLLQRADSLATRARSFDAEVERLRDQLRLLH